MVTNYIHGVIATSIETIKLKTNNGRPFFNTQIKVTCLKGKKKEVTAEINLLSDKKLSIEEKTEE
jgi:hypothetical protein|tara:strand:+ start:192 stop:386 length:195 start_codon:yes stop_codon:yes gene_type:complete